MEISKIVGNNIKEARRLKGLTQNDVAKIMKMLEMLDDLDDVQDVYHNGELPEDEEEDD